MAGPWELYGGPEVAEDGPWARYQKSDEAPFAPRDPAVTARLKAEDPATYDPAYQYAPGAVTTSEKIKEIFGRGASAALRPLAQAVAAPGNLVADTAQSYGWLAKKGLEKLRPQSLSDLIVDKQSEPFVSQSQRFNQALDSKTFAPQTTMGRINEGVASALIGSRIPIPPMGKQAPAGFVPPPKTPQAATFAAGRDLGLAAPPASVSPSLMARAAETLGGKVATAQDASVQNMPVFTNIAKRAIGLADDQDLTLDALNQVRRSQAPSFEAIRGIGQIQATDKYRKALESIAAPFRSASKDFASLGKSEVTSMVDDLNKSAFDSASAVDAIKLIRDNANKAYAAGDKSLGGAYKGMAKALEDVIEDNLVNAGDSGSDILRNFRAAREMTAKTYSVEKALNPATGVVSGTKLAQQVAKGKPLSGDLRTAGQFAQAFPKASREILDSGSVRNTDLIVGGGTAAMTGQPWYLGYPLVRAAARSGVLSKAAQEKLLKEGGQINPAWFGAIAPLSVRD